MSLFLVMSALGMLIYAGWIDFTQGILPNELTLGATGMLLLSQDLQGHFSTALGGAALGFGILKAAQWIYRRVRGRDGLGSGDAKLMLSLGALVGPSGVFAVIGGASLLALLVNLPRFLQAPPDVRGQTAVPFGPYLVLAGLAVKFVVPTLFPSGVNYG